MKKFDDILKEYKKSRVSKHVVEVLEKTAEPSNPKVVRVTDQYNEDRYYEDFNKIADPIERLQAIASQKMHEMSLKESLTLKKELLKVAQEISEYTEKLRFQNENVKKQLSEILDGLKSVV